MTSERDARREELAALDDAHVWHPFTPHSIYREEEPLIVERGEGHELIDVDGNRYLDGVSSLWCSNFGHRRPEIDHAITEQLDRVAHATFLGNAHDRGIELARRIVDATPEGLSRVFFSDNGSTAVEIAVKMSWQFWRQCGEPGAENRTRFLAVGEAYHGDTIGAVSVGGIDLFHQRFGGLLFDVLRGPSPHCYRCPVGLIPETCATECLDAFEKILAESGEEICAVILEPGMQGAGGMIPYPPGFLRKLAAMTRAAGALLCFDEVAMGMGRSGRLFVCEKEDVTPDFLCLAKGITSGYLPLAATVTTERVFEAFLGPPEEGRTFFHGHTFTANPLAAAAALATFDIFENGDVLESLPARVKYLSAALESLRVLPAVGDIRQFGMAVGIELVADRATKRRFDATERRGMSVCIEAKREGVFLRPLGDIVVLMPPLTLSNDEIDRLVDAVHQGIVRACGDVA